MPEVNLGAMDAFAVVLIISGILACFFGYRLFRFVLGITGFLLGWSLGWILLTGAGYGQTVVITGAILGALLGAVAMFSLLYVGLFVFGSAVGLLLGSVVLTAGGSDRNALAAGIFALVGGLVTVIFRKALLVVSMALAGAWSALSGIFYFSKSPGFIWILSGPPLLRSAGHWYYLFLALWALLAVAGTSVQLRALSRRKKRRQS